MNRRTFNFFKTSLLAGLLTVTFMACDSASSLDDENDSAQEEVAALSNTLTQELSLSTGQQSLINSFGDRRYDPRLLWELAAALQDSLTDEQKAELLARTDRMMDENFCPTNRFGNSGFGFRGPKGGGGCLKDVLTDEQTAAAEDIKANYKTQIEALIEQKRNDEITQEDFRAEIQTLHEAIKAEIDALLTDEQKDAIEACRADQKAEREAEIAALREENRQAMSDVLGLSSTVETTLFGLMDEHQAAVEGLFTQLKEESISCEDFQEAITTIRGAYDEALQDLLDDTQWEIVQIHRAISRRGRPFGGHHGKGKGRGGPGGHGQGMGTFGGFGGFGVLAG